MTSPFETHFAAIYQDRWPQLKAALLCAPERIERSCFDGFAQYTLDRASIFAADALQVQPGDQVLDMCAAPGGKTLVLLEALRAKGSLIANELSLARRKRLEEVIRTHVPAANKEIVKVTGYDANLFGLKRAGEFDRVLLDAPCSSERHLLEDDQEMKDWKLSRTKQLAQRQYSLLCAGMLALKPGGTLVYSTCSISPLENDGVVGRLLERKSEMAELDTNTDDLKNFERTRYGFQIFPDTQNNAGPIYISRLKKRA